MDIPLDAKNWMPPQLEIDSDALAFWNAALTYTCRELPLFSEKMVFAFDITEPPEYNTPICCFKHKDDISFYVCIEDFPFQKMLGVQLDYKKIEALGDDLRNAFNKGIVDILKKLLPKEISAEILSERWGLYPEHVPPKEQENIVWFQIEVVYKKAADIVLLIGLQPKDFKTLLARETLMPQPVQKDMLKDVTATLSYCIASMTLRLSEVKNLETGDFIVLPEDVSTQTLHLTKGRLLYSFRKDKKGWQCIGIKKRHFPNPKPLLTPKNP